MTQESTSDATFSQEKNHQIDAEQVNKMPEREPLKNVTILVYALLGLSVFIGISAVVAVIINYVKKEDVEGTLFASHFRWQIRTFWFALLWMVIGWATLVFWVGGIIIFVIQVWIAYRVIKGCLRLYDGKEMYT